MIVIIPIGDHNKTISNLIKRIIKNESIIINLDENYQLSIAKLYDSIGFWLTTSNNYYVELPCPIDLIILKLEELVLLEI